MPEDNHLAAPAETEDVAGDASLDKLDVSQTEQVHLPATADSKAKREAVSFAEGLDLEGKEREHNRHQTFRDHVNIAVLIVLWLIVVVLLAGIAIFAFHMLTPEAAHFLTPTQLSDLKAMLGTAILSSALTGYAKGRMN